MLSIFKLRFLFLKRDYKIIVLMMLLSLAFTLVFGSAGSSEQSVFIGIAYDNVSSEEKVMMNAFIDSSDDYILFETSDLEKAVSDDEIIFGALIKDETIEIIKKSRRADIIQREIAFKNNLMAFKKDQMLLGIMSAQTGNFEDVAMQFEEEKKYSKSFSVKKSQLGTSKWLQYDELLHGILGFTLYFSTFSMVFGMGDIVEDKRLYTWHRLLTTPIKLRDIILGNLFFYSTLGLVQITLVFVIGQWLFNVAFNGQLLGVIVITSLYVLVMNGLGLLIASMVKDAHQLSAVSPIVLTAMAMIGGCMWPIELVRSKVLLALSYFTPHRWTLSAIKELVMTGQMTLGVLQSSFVLIAMGLLLIGLGSFKILRKPI